MDENTEVLDLPSETEATETAENNGGSEEFTEREKKLFARAKEAEAKAKKLREENEALKNKPQEKINPPTIDTEELRLIAKGLTDEDIEKARIISKGKGISLSEAIKDPMFVAAKEKEEAERKKEDAKLGASKGSSQADGEKVFKSGLTREEHMAAWKES